MLVYHLTQAQLFITTGEYVLAIGQLQAARLIAKSGKTVKMKVIAAYCVVAQQALMPYLMGVNL